MTVYNKVNAAAYFGTGTFNFQSLFWSPGYDNVVPEDVNSDGKADIILYNSATGTEYSGLSNGDGTFTYTYQYWGIGKVLAVSSRMIAAAVVSHGNGGAGQAAGSATSAALPSRRWLRWRAVVLPPREPARRACRETDPVQTVAA